MLIVTTNDVAGRKAAVDDQVDQLEQPGEQQNEREDGQPQRERQEHLPERVSVQDLPHGEGRRVDRLVANARQTNNR